MRILIIGLVVLALSVAGISTYLIQNFSTPEAIGEMEKKARVITYYTLVANFDLQPGDSLTKENIEVDGVEYPLFKLEISNTSHPFYTGKMKLVDTAGRVDKFMNKYQKHLDKRKAPAQSN